MAQQEQTPIQLPNAPHWQPHSLVSIKEEYLAEDEAWVQNNMFAVEASNPQNPNMRNLSGNRNILIVQRMAQPGSVVATKRRNGSTKTVHLPEEAGQLAIADLSYIVGMIDKLNTPVLTPEEQTAFLASVSALFATS